MASTKVPSIDDITTLPQATHITLLLRHHKSTTLVSVSPTQSFDSIKDLLLSALQARNISSLHNALDPANPIPLPSSSSQIELGVLIDKKDASKGWTLFNPDIAASSSGKKKAFSKSADSNTPEGLGLVDGSWMAYRVSNEANNEKGGSDVDADGDVVVDVDIPEDPGWDVLIPTFDEEEEEVEEEAAEVTPS